MNFSISLLHDKIKVILSERLKPLRRYLPLIYQLLLLTLLIAAFKVPLFSGALSLMSNIIGSLADALIILIIALLIGKLWRPLFLLPVIVLTIIIIANIIYSRNFGDILPPSLYAPGNGSINPFVIEGVKASIHWYDPLWLVPAVLSFICYKRMGIPKLGSKGWTTIVLCCILFNIAACGLALRRISKYKFTTTINQTVEEYLDSWTHQICANL